MTLLDATAFVLEATMFTTFVALVFSAATGLRCELHIDDRQQVWHISADVEARAFAPRPSRRRLSPLPTARRRGVSRRLRNALCWRAAAERTRRPAWGKDRRKL